MLTGFKVIRKETNIDLTFIYLFNLLKYLNKVLSDFSSVPRLTSGTCVRRRLYDIPNCYSAIELYKGLESVAGGPAIVSD